jgi:hypothetical protein
MQRSPAGTTSSDGGGTRTEQYYQYDADDQLRAGSPHPIQASAEPPAAPVVSSPSRQSEHDEILKRRLTRFYEQYNPAMVPRIDQIVERYRGRERELWHNIYQKYAKDEGGTFAVGFPSISVAISFAVCRGGKYHQARPGRLCVLQCARVAGGHVRLCCNDWLYGYGPHGTPFCDSCLIPSRDISCLVWCSGSWWNALFAWHLQQGIAGTSDFHSALGHSLLLDAVCILPVLGVILDRGRFRMKI